MPADIPLVLLSPFACTAAAAFVTPTRSVSSLTATSTTFTRTKTTAAGRFSPTSTSTTRARLNLFNFGGGGSSGRSGGTVTATVPKSPSARDNQAITSVRAAIASPKVPSFPLVEVEFPPLAELNKLGDGTLRSAREVEDANASFAVKLAKAISIPFVGPKVVILTSSAAAKSFVSTVAKKVGGSATVVSVKDGIPQDTGPDDVVVFLTPSTSGDYRAAETMASSGTLRGVVIINGFAKDNKSVKQDATMAFFLKPLTYNSQIAGYLVRSYPNSWSTIDAATNEVLGSFSDDEILVRKTNTPDLRAAVKLVQNSFDQRAIESRRRG
mmetsp:Transcript_35502/g.77753  ORF Transcript_35502/g.77753 Transcript_35502/m.77753 type:complete len:326 (-) Transcript_35502:105-1082(-)